jgi:hypothetical protein
MRWPCLVLLVACGGGDPATDAPDGPPDDADDRDAPPAFWRLAVGSVRSIDSWNNTQSGPPPPPTTVDNIVIRAAE